MTLTEANDAMQRLLLATLDYEAAVAERDKKIAELTGKYAERVNRRTAEIAALEAALEEYCIAGLADGEHVIPLTGGTIGMRTATTAALVPLSDKWTWDKIGRTLKRLYKAKFFLAPKPPSIDKVKVKRELSDEQLAKCGMKLAYSESFYYELDRPQKAAA